MSKVTQLESKVKALYEQKNRGRSNWADWLWENHVLVVADYATSLSKRFGANIDLARAAALLHDIADYRMQRENPAHEQTSLDIARQLLEEFGYSKAEISVIVDDALRFHSCHEGQRPASVEGKVLATADALGHLKTDFYLYAVWKRSDSTLPDLKAWALKKLERDFHNKILFDEVREEATSDYNLLKDLFSR